MKHMSFIHKMDERGYRYVEFSTDATEKIFSVRIVENNEAQYFENYRRVDRLQNTPIAKRLIMVVTALVCDGLVKNFMNSDYDSPEYRSAWWALSDKIDELLKNAMWTV